jgi:hypothetical protein
MKTDGLVGPFYLEVPRGVRHAFFLFEKIKILVATKYSTAQESGEQNTSTHIVASSDCENAHLK